MTQTQRFDQEAATWDENPRRVRLAKEVAETIARRLPLARNLKVLDFGCGTGLLTLNLQPLVGTITGADTSEGMLNVLRQKVRGQSLTNVDAFQLKPDNDYAIEGTYDLIVSSMTLHHVQDLAPLFRRFRDHLRDHGWVALADLDTEDGTFHQDNHDVFHLGFERSAFKAQLQDAGFTSLTEETAFENRRNGRDYPVFLITGRKQAH